MSLIAAVARAVMRSEEVDVGGGEMSSRLLDGVLRPDPDPGMESLDYEVVESAAARRREAEAGRGGRGRRAGGIVYEFGDSFVLVTVRRGRWGVGNSTTWGTSP